MRPPLRAVIEGKPENPGRLVVIDGAHKRQIPLAALALSALEGLAEELRARGYQADLLDTDVEAQTPAHTAEAALRSLGLAPPYRALAATLAKSPPGSGPAPS